MALLGALVAGVLVVAAIADVLLERSERLAHTSMRGAVSSTATVIRPGGRSCGIDTVPREAGKVRLFTPIDVKGPPLAITIEDRRGRRITEGQRSGGYFGEVVVPLRRPHRGAGSAVVCVKNRGRRSVSVADLDAEFTGSALVAGDAKSRRKQVRVDFLFEGRPRNLDVASFAVRRASLQKSSLVVPWVVWAALFVVPLATAVGAWTVILEVGANE